MAIAMINPKTEARTTTIVLEMDGFTTSHVATSVISQTLTEINCWETLDARMVHWSGAMSSSSISQDEQLK
jgi:hypothetical protein